MKSSISLRFAAAALGASLAALAFAAPAQAQYNQYLRHDPARCRDDGPAVRVNITGVKSSSGTVRVQRYRGTRADWLETGREPDTDDLVLAMERR